MRAILSILATAAVLSLMPAAAPSARAASAEAGKPDEAENDRKVVAPNVITPVVRDGKLVNYLFVTVEVELSDSANLLKMRDMAAFLRDSLLRASHRAALGDPASDTKLNFAAAKQAFAVASVEALGAQNIKKITITGVDSLRRP